MNQKMAKYHTLLPVKNRIIADSSVKIRFLADVNFDQIANRAANKGKWYFPFSVFLSETFNTNMIGPQNGFQHFAVVLNDFSMKSQVISGTSVARRRKEMTEVEKKWVKTKDTPRTQVNSIKCI